MSDPSLKTTRDRLVPYKVLGYLLYTSNKPWLNSVAPSSMQVRLTTGEAARFFRLKAADLWGALWWLEKAGLIKVEKEKKRGSALITLKSPER